MNVHIVHPPEGEARQLLEKSLHPDLTISYGDDLPPGRKIDILVAGRPPKEHVDLSPPLQALIIPWAGIPTGTRKLMEDYPEIPVFNLHHNAVPTAELALALLLAAAKKVLVYDQALRSNDWRLRYQPDDTILLQGKQALILGYGEIGRRIARVLQALNIEVSAIRRHGSGELEEGVRVYSPRELDGLLSEADILILALPLTAETRGLIGEERLELLPEKAVLVNVSRGPIIDQKALYQALRSGALGGAGLDVWYHYPKTPEDRRETPPADYPFQSLENVVLSPHRGGKSPSIESLRMEALAASLNQAAEGNPIPNPVNIQAGY
jgi:phosphoglycerate dehydrogenase-like enzyme